jgi:hypothetical protein
MPIQSPAISESIEPGPKRLSLDDEENMSEVNRLTYFSASVSEPPLYDFHTPNADTSDPVPLNCICPTILQQDVFQLDDRGLCKLKPQCCVQQHCRGLLTPHWPNETDSNKVTYWDCYVDNEDVWMRWLGGNASVILQLISRLLRKPGVGPEDVDYSIWDGERTDRWVLHLVKMWRLCQNLSV